MHAKTIVLAAVIGVQLGASAATYRRLPDAADWTSPTSYASGEYGTTPLSPDDPLPGAGDTVYVSGASTNKLFLSTADTAQWAAFNAVGWWRIKYGNRVVITVPEGQEGNLTAKVNFKGWGVGGNINEGGGLIKRGAGTLVFDTPASGDSPAAGRAFHECYVEVEEGAVALTRHAVEFSYDNYMYGKFTLAKGTRLYLPRRDSRTSYFRTSVWGFEGEGTVVAEDPGTGCYVVGRVPCSFSGVFEGYPSLTLGGCQALMNPDSKLSTVSLIGSLESPTSVPEWNDEGAACFKFGNPGQPSSIGTNAQIAVGNSDQNGGVMHYLGEGETSSKAFYIGRTKNHPFILDGGAGGLTLTGGFSLYGYDKTMERIVLEGTGTGAHESVLSGGMSGYSDGDADYEFIVTKRGPGTWSLKNTRRLKGCFYVQDGTLKFDSIGETNEVSALGYSTVRTINKSCVSTDSANLVPYAFQLGSTATNNAAVGKGLMEYTGTERGRTTTRMAQINGAGGFVNNGDASFRLADVTAGACTNNTLYLGGSGSGGNELQDLSGAMSVVKEGSGTWFLSGSNTFSGTVSVDGGTLWVRDPARYSWYRWIVFNTVKTNSQFGCRFFGLYDKDNRLVSGDLDYGNNLHQLAPGETHLEDGKYFRRTNSFFPGFTNMFSSLCKDATTFYLRREHRADGIGDVVSPIPDADSRTNAFAFAVRLRDGVEEPVSYDFLCAGTWHGAVQPGTPADWLVEASPDGQRWDLVSPRQKNYTTRGANAFWRFSGEAFTPTVGETSFADHTNGAVFVQTRRNPADVLPVFNNVTSVKVAKGATLKTDPGAALELKGLAADVAGAGRIENFNLAETGSVAITGVTNGLMHFSLPLELVNVDGVQNLADGWSFTINGETNPKWTMNVDPNGRVTFSKTGLILIIR